MTSSPRLPFGPWTVSLRSLRWGSGLVLWAYVALHLANHALGLVSLAAAEQLRHWLHAPTGLWGSWPGTLLLYGAALVHLVMAGAALWQRRGLGHLPWLEGLRLLLGLCLPLLLAAHVLGTRWLQYAWEVPVDYRRTVEALASPLGVALQLALMAAAWIHGCLGLHLALRRRAGWRRWQPALLLGAVLLPVLALTGWLSMAREAALLPPPAPLPPEAAQALRQHTLDARLFWLGLLATWLAARALHLWHMRRHRIAVHYPGQTVRVPRGWSVLETSQAHGIAHASQCGGRGRCSTCRIHVQAPLAHLPPPGPDERRTLARVQAPPGVRLACQLRPRGDVHVTPLMPTAAASLATRQGREHAVAVLFVDLRRWSGLAERQLPFDLVYVLEQYFSLVAAAVRDSGGLPNQFIGDSVMAIFGLDSDLPTACRQALLAAGRIEERMEGWNTQFRAQFGQRLDFGIGIHAGPVALGRVGDAQTTSFTAVGEVVNTASRLQDHSKTAATRLVISETAARLAGAQACLGTAEHIQVRGRREGLAVFYVDAPSQLMQQAGPQ